MGSGETRQLEEGRTAGSGPASQSGPPVPEEARAGQEAAGRDRRLLHKRRAGHGPRVSAHPVLGVTRGLILTFPQPERPRVCAQRQIMPLSLNGAHLATTHLTGEWTALFLGPERCRDRGLLATLCLPVTPGSLPSSVRLGGPGAGLDKAPVHPSHSGRGPGGLPPGPWKATKGKSTRPAQRGTRRTAATRPRATVEGRAGTSKKTGETRNLKGKVALRRLEPGPSSRDSGAQERGCLGCSWR